MTRERSRAMGALVETLRQTPSPENPIPALIHALEEIADAQRYGDPLPAVTQLAAVAMAWASDLYQGGRYARQTKRMANGGSP